MTWIDPTRDSEQSMAEQIARVATESQQRRTGHGPNSVRVILSGDTLVVTLHGALSPAEQAMSQSLEGAAKVQEFHRQLFQSASETLREDIRRITGMDVREAAAEVEPASGAVVQVLTSGTMVQVFLLSGEVPSGSFDGGNETSIWPLPTAEAPSTGHPARHPSMITPTSTD
jgi:uncharacterized protein YbcI